MWWDPWGQVASQAAKIANDAWISACLSVWNAGLWLLRFVLQLMDNLLTPDVSSDGPGQTMYGWTYWMAGGLSLILIALQIGAVLLRRDGKALGHLVLGLGKFVIAVSVWVGGVTTLVVAAGAMTHGVMDSMLGVSTWNKWDFAGGMTGQAVADGATATVLMLAGLFMWLAAVAHFLVIVARDVALVMLVATGPIAAAGLVHQTFANWFWKMLRWVIVAVFSPLLVVLVTGTGVQFATGVAAGQGTGTLAAIGTAFTSVILICIAAVSPLALFKMLAFVDPGTSSGAAMRAGWAASGGLQGMLGGGSASGGVGGSAAESSEDGTSSGEASAEAATSARVSGAVQSGAGRFGPAGQMLSAGIGAMTKVGMAAGSAVVDVTNQEGVGHNTYQPDYQGGSSGGSGWEQNRRANEQDQSGEQGGGDPQGGDGVADQTEAPMAPSTATTGSSPQGQGFSDGGPGSPIGQGGSSASSSSGASGGTGGAAGAAGGEAAEAAVLIV